MERIVAAIEQNFYAFGATQFIKWPRIEYHDDGQLSWFMSDVPSTMFNVVQRTRLSPDNVAEKIKELKMRYAERHLPLTWFVDPFSTPLDLSRHLTSAGFLPSGEMTGMAIDLQTIDASLHPRNFTIKATVDDNSLELFARTLCKGFEMPEDIGKPLVDQALAMGYGTEGPLINYVGYLEDQPVASSSLFLHDGVAGVYNVATVPEARGQGVGTAVTMAPLLEATKRGYRLAVLHSSLMAFSLYRHIGFDTYCYFHQYVWSEDTAPVKTGPANAEPQGA